MDILIRPGLPTDSRQLCEISSRAHLSEVYLDIIPPARLVDFKKKYMLSEERSKWFSRQYQNRLADPNWHYFVAYGGGDIYGYTCCQTTADTLQLRGLFVDPTCQSKGIGKRLFAASLSIAPRPTHIQLEVLVSNEKAKRLYEQFGFRSKEVSKTTFYGLSLEVMEQG